MSKKLSALGVVKSVFTCFISANRCGPSTPKGFGEGRVGRATIVWLLSL